MRVLRKSKDLFVVRVERQGKGKGKDTAKSPREDAKDVKAREGEQRQRWGGGMWGL